MKEATDDLEPAAAGDVQTEYSSDYLYNPSTGAVSYLSECRSVYVLSDYLEYLIIQYLFGARLMEFYCTN
jgi:hypothetical protein